MHHPNTIFADSLKYAKAYHKWMEMDPNLWGFNIYGGTLAGSYDRAIILRPLEGVTQEHILWVTICLAPRVDHASRIVPIHWTYEEIFGSIET